MILIIIKGQDTHNDYVFHCTNDSDEKLFV